MISLARSLTSTRRLQRRAASRSAVFAPTPRPGVIVWIASQSSVTFELSQGSSGTEVWMLTVGLRLQIRLWGVASLPYLEAVGERLYVAIVLIEVGLKRPQMHVGVAPGSCEMGMRLVSMAATDEAICSGRSYSYGIGAEIGAGVWSHNGSASGPTPKYICPGCVFCAIQR